MHSCERDCRMPLLVFAFCLFFSQSLSHAYKVQLVTDGFSSPVAVTAPPGDTHRLFVIELNSGLIRIYNRVTQQIETTEFMDVPSIITGGERGLLGIAFHPGYATNGYFYVNYSAVGGGAAGHNEIARFTANAPFATGNTANPNTKKLLLTYNQPESNHNGGWIGFGLDGYLYIATGDGGGGNDQHGTIGNAQDRTTLLGKILRIDVDNGDPYSIPTSNPYFGDAIFKQEIFAFGMRNPWRCSIDRTTGDLWIGDVGEGAREEIDFNPAGVVGVNYGWRPREGTIANPSLTETPVTTATDPIYNYPRTLGNCVTGGYIYRGTWIPELQGKYLFGDYGSSRFWTITQSSPSPQEQTSIFSTVGVGNPVSFGEDGVGELLVLDLADGELFRLVPDPPTANPDSLSRQTNQPAKIHLTQLLANDSVPSPQSTTLSSVGNPSIPGATVVVDGGWVIYEAPQDSNGSDSFTYTIRDGAGSTSTSTINVTVGDPGNEQTKNVISVVQNGADVIVTFAGIPGRSYEIQTTSSLSPPINWTPHPSGAHVAGANGTFQLTDPAPPSPRFYRALQLNP
jgi:glucose/arabinose dehydrogenase